MRQRVNWYHIGRPMRLVLAGLTIWLCLGFAQWKVTAWVHETEHKIASGESLYHYGNWDRRKEQYIYSKNARGKRLKPGETIHFSIRMRK